MSYLESSKRIEEYVLRFVRTASGNPQFNASAYETSEIFRRLSGALHLSNNRGTFDGDQSRHLGKWTPSEYRVDSIVRNAQRNASKPVRWPGNKPFAACLTHDVDNISQSGGIRRVTKRIRKLLYEEGSRVSAAIQVIGGLYRLGTNPFIGDRLKNMDRWLTLESKHGIVSTWFFLPDRYARYHVYDGDYSYSDIVVFRDKKMRVENMIRYLSESSCEIGLHGSYYSADSAELLSDQRRQLELVVGKKVTAIRQHYLRYDVDNTPRSQCLAGFLCDSTQGYNTRIGIPAETVFPFWAWDLAENRQLQILEVPMCIMDGPLLRNVSLRGIEMAIARAMPFIEQASKMGGCIVLNWHSNHICRKEYWESYRIIAEELKNRNAWFCTISNLKEEWEKREMRIGTKGD